MKRSILCAVLLLAVGASAFSQTPVTSTLTVSDNQGNTKVLTFGLDPAATDGIDAALGEVEQPPAPPSGAFDARFIGDEIELSLGQGLLVDYREGNITTDRVHVHEIKYQVGTDGTQITVAWNLFPGVHLRIQDFLGVVIDVTVTGSGSQTVTNPGIINKLKLTATYVAIEMPVELVSFSAAASGNDIVLYWKTQTELDNYGFSIERSLKTNKDGWETIGFVKGSGTSWVPKEYTYTDRTAHIAHAYCYRLKQIDRSGAWEYTQAVEASIAAPRAFSVEQNYPNPFNPSTTIRFTLSEKSAVTLAIYDRLGREVERLISREMDAGYYEIRWEPKHLSSGVYFYELTTNAHREMKKMTYVK